MAPDYSPTIHGSADGVTSIFSLQWEAARPVSHICKGSLHFLPNDDPYWHQT